MLSTLQAALGEIQSCTTATTLEDATQAISELPNGLLFCTEALDNASGCELIQATKQKNPTVQCMLLITRRSVMAMQPLRNSRADVILADWDLDSDECPALKAIEAIRSRKRYASPSVRTWLTHDDAPAIEQLTPRQHAVLGLILRGFSNADISRELVISPSTAKSYSRDVLRKLGVQSRHHAVLKAMELGLNAELAS